MNRISKLLFVAALGLAATGTGLAVAQPGGLGDDDSAETAAVAQDPTTTTSTTTAAPASTTPTTPDVTEAAGDEIAAPATPEAETSTTASGGGSGLDASGAAESVDTRDGLASTGGTSLIGAGAVAALAAVALRRRSARA